MRRGIGARRDSVLLESLEAQKLQPMGMDLAAQPCGGTVADTLRPVAAWEAPVVEEESQYVQVVVADV